MTVTITSGPLEDERLPDGRRVLERDLIYSLGIGIFELSGYKGVALVEKGLPDGESFYSDTIITVPKGFDTDFSTIPSIVVPVLGEWQKYDMAGVLHDWLYRIQAPRAICDRIWRMTARSGEPHCNAVQGWLGWAGIRLGAWIAYRQRGKELKS